MKNSMKKTIVLLLALFTFSASFAQTKVYSGYINDTLRSDRQNEIEMHLRKVGEEELYGYYFHKQNPKAINGLHSRFSEHAFQLFEGDEVQGYVFFDGTLNDSTMSGKWKHLSEYKTLDFAAKEFKTDTLSKRKDKFSGYYELNTPGVAKNIRIVFIDNKHFYLNGNIGSKKCTGYIQALAKMTGPNKAVYSDPKCRQITFTFSPKTVSIVESGCNKFHGSSCNFTGIYKLKK